MLLTLLAVIAGLLALIAVGLWHTQQVLRQLAAALEHYTAEVQTWQQMLAILGQRPED